MSSKMNINNITKNQNGKYYEMEDIKPLIDINKVRGGSFYHFMINEIKARALISVRKSGGVIDRVFFQVETLCHQKIIGENIEFVNNSTYVTPTESVDDIILDIFNMIPDLVKLKFNKSTNKLMNEDDTKTQDIINSIFSEDNTCSVCLDNYVKSKTRCCNQSLCFPCASLLHTKGRGVVKCPMCRRIFNDNYDSSDEDNDE